jgi:hypothetical protein
MEQVLEVYRRPFDPKRPVICMDEQPKQLIRESRTPLPLRPGQVERYDYEYVREGMCCVWMFVEPLGAWRAVRVSARKSILEWAEQVRALLEDERYADAERITLVCDNLNTHRLSSLYAAFAPGKALALANKLELVHTPVHGSWLNMAEPELSVLTRQCLARHIAKLDTLAHEAGQWARERNAKQVGIDWQFTTDDARIKLKHLYPKIEM